jgi:hypothetical protein
MPNFLLSSLVRVPALLLASAAMSFTVSAQPLASINAPSAEQFTKTCANTADPADCGKKIEALQLPRAGNIVKRVGNLLAVTVPGEPPFMFEDKLGEAGPNVSFYAYHAGADAVVLYRAQADKLDFLLVQRGVAATAASITELPNEPFFNSDGRFFVTADFCSDGCENRLSVWRFERRGPARERVFSPRTPWADASVSWGTPRRLIVDYAEGGKNLSLNLELSDPRWVVLLP